MSQSSESTLHFLDYWRVIRMRWPIITIIFLLVVSTAGMVCYFLPKEFASKTMIEVHPDDAGMQVFGGDGSRGQFNVQGWRAATQVQIIMSKAILYPVIEKLDLVERWSQGKEERISLEEAYRKLQRSLSQSDVIRGTEVIQIVAFSVDSQEAADIANTVAESYKARRESEQKGLLDRNLLELREEVNKARTAEREALEKVQRIRSEQGIIDFNPETLEQAVTQAEPTLAKEETLVSETQQRIVQLRSQLEQIEQLKPEELLNALTTLGLQDPIIGKIQPVYQEILVEETRLLNAGLGENHPRIKSLHAQRRLYGEQLQTQLNALRASLSTQLKMAESTVAALEKKLENTRKEFQEARVQSVEYLQAKTDYIRLKRVVEAAETKLQTQGVQLGLSIYPVKIWEPAEASDSYARPNVAAYMSVAIVLGLGLGVLFAFFMEYLDTSVKTLEEAEQALNVPVLAVVPKGVHYLVNSAGDLPEEEVYRILQTNLEVLRKESGFKTVTIVSGGLGEGKSTTLNNLAVTYARGGFKVLIVDADLRRSSQHQIFGVANDKGLTDVLSGDTRFDDAVHKTKIPNLSLLPAGKIRKDGAAVLSSPQMAEFLEYVKGAYDMIFFDSPPILGLSDASILTRDVEMTLMVIQYRRFPRSMLLRVKQGVEQVGGRLVGVVLNNVDTRREANYHYYTQYYNYYGDDGEKRRDRRSGSSSVATTSAKHQSTHSDDY